MSNYRDLSFKDINRTIAYLRRVRANLSQKRRSPEVKTPFYVAKRQYPELTLQLPFADHYWNKHFIGTPYERAVRRRARL